MLLTAREKPVLAVNAVYITVFTAMALTRSNYEFVMYAGVVLAAALWVLAKQHVVKFDMLTLWGLTLWGLLHMAGGNITVADGVLYDVQLVPVVLRYDQFVHLVGFGVATLLCFHLLRPFLRDQIPRRRTLLILAVLMGSGLGAINEIIEYVAVVIMPDTNVGGYENTCMDLVFNLIGGLIAACYLGLTGRVAPPTCER